MKRITLLLIAIIACLFTATAQVENSNQPVATENQIEYTDTPDSSNSSKKGSSPKNNDSFFNINDFAEDIIIPIVAITLVFGMPIIIVFFAFYFRYKNRKAKYQLAEKALAAGQPIPENIFNEKGKGSPTLNKGITNTCTGIGLFIFLWAITGAFSIGCIGLLVMFTGIGQIIIHYTSQKEKEADFPKGNDNNPTI